MWPLWAPWNSSTIWRNGLELVIMMLGFMMMVIVMLKRMNFLTMRCTWQGSSVHSRLQTKRRVLRLPSGWHNSCQSYRTHVYLGSDLWVRMPVSVRPFWDLTDVTLADENTSSIQADNANSGGDYALLTKTKYQNKWLIIYEHLVLVVDHLEDDLPHQVDEGEHSAAHQGRGQNWPLGNAFHTILTMRWDLVKNMTKKMATRKRFRSPVTQIWLKLTSHGFKLEDEGDHENCLHCEKAGNQDHNSPEKLKSVLQLVPPSLWRLPLSIHWISVTSIHWIRNYLNWASNYLCIGEMFYFDNIFHRVSMFSFPLKQKNS